MDIIATIWKKPYFADRNQRMIDAGADVFRVKCGHIPIKEISECLQFARQHISQQSRPVRLLADLPEAKIRIGEFPQETAQLTGGEEYRFLHGPLSGDPEAYIPVKTAGLGRLLREGDVFTLCDGSLSFCVTTVHGENEFIARAKNTNTLIQRTSLVAPRIMDQLNHIVPEIDEILAELPKSKPDMVAFSFVKSQDMMLTLANKLLSVTTANWRPMMIAKIESQEGVDNIDEILEVCHGIMVARGDLALNVPYEELGLIQKRLVAKARQAGKYVIVSTRMLSSMLTNHVPQRSDILDVTNTCLDGASAILLCPETAHSEHPERAVEAARKIITAVEAS